MQPQPYPIIEFDPSPEAIIEPSRMIAAIDAPEHCVLCFFQEVIEKLRNEGKAKEIARLNCESAVNPVYEILVAEQRLALCHPGVGAPSAAAFLEEMIALGCKKFIACGGAGVLDKQIAVGHLLVPTAAIRDEGTSYHYLPPGREVAPAPEAVAAIETVLQRHKYEYLLTKTWTTDAIYRETTAKAALRRAEGCLTVEMEAAAFFAVAQFRGVPFGQILYGGDAVCAGEWDSRDWVSRADIREQLFWLAAEACLKL
jgi:uridine phosphorylase